MFIIKPLWEYKEERARLPEHERNLIDMMIVDMINLSFKLKDLGIVVDNHFVNFTLASGQVLHYIFDMDDESLLVMLFPGATP